MVTGCGEHGSSGRPGGLLEPRWLELEPTLERTEVLNKLQQRRQNDEGFTLIELMVVVLIMGILMAIAIPTFLSTRGSANDASAKSNATNALTNEKSYYASNQAFLDAPDTTNGATLDNSLPWPAAGAKSPLSAKGDVAAYAFTDAAEGTEGDGPALIVEALSQSGNCFYIQDVESQSTSYVGYAETTGGCVSTPSAMTAAAQTGPVTGLGATIGGWYQSW
jgi:type IV pilus assembly protein PilA